MVSILRSLWGRLAGNKGAGEEPASEAFEYNGYRIRAAPYESAGGFQTAGVIEKDFADGAKEHRFVRAEAHPSRDAAVAFTIAKGKQIIDEQGERVFGKQPT
jgi:hypothetical protein